MLCLFSPHFATEEVLRLLGPKINVEKDPSVAELLSPALFFALYFVFPPWGRLQGQNLFWLLFFNSWGLSQVS